MEGKKRLDPGVVVKSALSKALETQYPAAAANVARLRRVHPEMSPEQLISFMKRVYLGTVGATGAAAGGASIVPNGWLQGPVAAADLLSFLEASVLYTLSVLEVHGVDVEDVERRKLIVTSVLLGNKAATSALGPLIDRTVPYWGKQIVNSIPMAAVDAANSVLGPRFITKYGTKQGVLVLGKQVPMLLGVAIGLAGNELFGWLIVESARKILGPPPEYWAQSPDCGVEEPK